MHGHESYRKEVCELRTWEVVQCPKRQLQLLLGSEEILEIAEAAISAIFAACRDFW